MIGFTQPNAIAGALARDPQRAGTISALVGFMQFGAGAVGAAMAGGLAEAGTAANGDAAVPMAAVIFIAYVLAAVTLRGLLRKP
jgi:DHA1 family bicyclomycin/chloramphenicol resistance-like MFS transporter